MSQSLLISANAVAGRPIRSGLGMGFSFSPGEQNDASDASGRRRFTGPGPGPRLQDGALAFHMLSVGRSKLSYGADDLDHPWSKLQWKWSASTVPLHYVIHCCWCSMRPSVWPSAPEAVGRCVAKSQNTKLPIQTDRDILFQIGFKCHFVACRSLFRERFATIGILGLEALSLLCFQDDMTRSSGCDPFFGIFMVSSMWEVEGHAKSVSFGLVKAGWPNWFGWRFNW